MGRALDQNDVTGPEEASHLVGCLVARRERHHRVRRKPSGDGTVGERMSAWATDDYKRIESSVNDRSAAPGLALQHVNFNPAAPVQRRVRYLVALRKQLFPLPVAAAAQSGIEQRREQRVEPFHNAGMAAKAVREKERLALPLAAFEYQLFGHILI